jgi:hypothetical protein
MRIPDIRSDMRDISHLNTAIKRHEGGACAFALNGWINEIRLGFRLR